MADESKDNKIDGEEPCRTCDGNGCPDCTPERFGPLYPGRDNKIDGEEDWKFQRQDESGTLGPTEIIGPDDRDDPSGRARGQAMLDAPLDPVFLREGTPDQALVKADPEVQAGLVRADQANMLSLAEAAPIMADMVPAGRIKGKSGLALQQHVPMTRVVEHLGKQFPRNWHPPPNRATQSDKEFLEFWDEYWATADDEDGPTEEDYQHYEKAYRAVRGSKTLPKRGPQYQVTDKPCPLCKDERQFLHYASEMGLWRCFRCGHDSMDAVLGEVVPKLKGRW